jgi:hypothetical protein
LLADILYLDAHGVLPDEVPPEAKISTKVENMRPQYGQQEPGLSRN